MRLVSSVFLLAAWAAISCTVDSPLAIDSEIADFGGGRTVKMVPFKGRHSALSDPSPQHSCPAGQNPVGSTIEQGNATHLGSFTGNAVSCAQGLRFESASLTWIAANGDQVWLSLDLLADQPFFFDGPTTLVFTSEFDVVGGTGRFDGATGHVVIVTTVDLTGGTPNQTTWEGTISSPGSTKWSD